VDCDGRDRHAARFNGLALQVQKCSSAIRTTAIFFAFRGKRGDLIKLFVA